ncbi:hypothetical protein PAXINDRAFT_92421 [Paxillus involutus ATCC 200175]|uniref:Reverse transcriptase zinc-binding domain-containing protein n=1 Tax=Paxillus involutus ATCC 200175 TaxID=664439 RepID=A0A0C9TG08_PAXIN|nr:hypothetical protein PAXINDRAFT_92421 [Paxillus involutus ATCC 200175]
MEKSDFDNPDTTIPPTFRVHGIQLKAGSQRLFYKGIQSFREKKPIPRRTTIQLAKTKYAVCEINGSTPVAGQIWKSVQDRMLSKAIRGFLWKSLHEGYKIGEYWDRITNLERRGRCHLCGETETMEHILLECDESLASQTIWGLAECLWRKRETYWPEIRFGTILGCNLINFTDNKNRKQRGKSRLFTILMSESAHLIWKLRCERAIKLEGDTSKFHTREEIQNRWIFAMNSRLKMDMLLTDRARYGKKAIPQKTVLQTWSGVLLDEDNLPDNWIWQSGVLVGITSQRPPGRNR